MKGALFKPHPLRPQIREMLEAGKSEYQIVKDLEVSSTAVKTVKRIMEKEKQTPKNKVISSVAPKIENEVPDELPVYQCAYCQGQFDQAFAHCPHCGNKLQWQK